MTNVENTSPAQRAGITVGDIITRFDGKDVGSAKDLPRMVAQARPGSEATIEIWRAGESRTLKLTVGEVQAESARVASAASAPGQEAGRLGLTVSELPAAGRRALGVEFGLVVESVSGVNAQTPLQRGDVIVAVNNERFASLQEFNSRVAKAKPGGSLAVLIRRDMESLYVPVKVAPP